jgi:two-component system response regulator (stage 0 sporulation protein F)
MPKLLIVDDELDVREFARNFFRKRGIDVAIASGGSEALELVDKDKPDLMLLDVRMGGMSGLDVLRELRQRSASVKVVMVSGLEEEQVVKEATSLGALGFIHKPLILEELEKVVFRELGMNP